MGLDFKRIGRKAKELEPLNLRRLRKKQSNTPLRKKIGLRKRLKQEDLEKELEESETSRRRELIREGISALTA